VAREETRKSWVKEIVVTVTGSVLVLLIQRELGLTVKPPEARPAPGAAGASPDPRSDALRFYERATECARQGRYDQAVENHTEALRLDPTFAAAYAGRGWAYAQQNHFDRAIKDCTQAIRHDPTCAQAYLNRGWAHLQACCHEQAIQDCTEAIRLDPNLRHAYEIRSRACAQTEMPPYRRH
jgi:tetratricopeptide (TPR) repeat protein